MTPREIDALVAEKVMGWSGIHPTLFTGYDNTYTGEIQKPGWPPRLGCKVVPHYSTSYADAWTMVEHMRILGWGFILNDSRGQYRMRFWKRDGSDGWSIDEWVFRPDITLTVWEDTIPIAICLAALKAVGVWIPK